MQILGAADCICHFDFVVMLPPLKRIDEMNKDSLERCYKTVLKQRDNYHVSQVELVSLVDSLMYELGVAIDEVNAMRDIHNTDTLQPADHWDKESLHDAQVKLHELDLVT
jgi:hypothetical protein